MVDLKTQSKSIDFSGAVYTVPFKTVTALPGVCRTGEMIFKTNAPAGKNLYACSSTNTWSMIDTGSSSGSQGFADFTPTISGNSVTVGAGSAGFGNYTCPDGIETGTVTFTAGTGDAKIFIDRQCLLTTHASTGITATTSGTMVFANTSVPVYPLGSKPIADLTVVSGVPSIDRDDRALFSTTPLEEGSGIKFTVANGNIRIETDPAETPRLGGANIWTSENDFGASTKFKPRTGTGVPSAGECDAANVGSEYTRIDAQAPNASKYICSQTGVGVYSWEVLGAGSALPATAKYVIQAPDSTVPNGQALSNLPTGILKNTTGTGVLSIATGADLPLMVGDAGSGGAPGAVPAPAAGDGAAGKFLRADGSWAAPTPVTSAVPDPTKVTLVDEFCGGSVSSTGTMGELGWTSALIGSGGLVTKNISGTANHPCLYKIETGSSVSAGAQFYLGPNFAYSITDNWGAAGSSWEIHFLFRFNTAPNNKVARIGLFNGVIANPDYQIAAKYDSAADVNWKFVACNGPGPTCSTAIDSGVAAGNTDWHRLKIYRGASDANGTVRLCLDACSSPAQITTNVPTFRMSPGWIYVNNASGNTSQFIEADWFMLYMQTDARW